MSKLTAKSLMYLSRRSFISIVDNIRVENCILYSMDGIHSNAWQYANKALQVLKVSNIFDLIQVGIQNNFWSFSVDLLYTWLFSILYLCFLILLSLPPPTSLYWSISCEFLHYEFLKIILYANLVTKFLCFLNSVLLEPIFREWP